MNEHAGLHMHEAQIMHFYVQRTEMESRNKPSHMIGTWLALGILMAVANWEKNKYYIQPDVSQL